MDRSNGFDWRAQEAYLNSQPQFRVPIEVEGFGALKVHFVWKKSSRADATPLLLCHGFVLVAKQAFLYGWLIQL